MRMGLKINLNIFKFKSIIEFNIDRMIYSNEF